MPPDIDLGAYKDENVNLRLFTLFLYRRAWWLLKTLLEMKKVLYTVQFHTMISILLKTGISLCLFVNIFQQMCALWINL